MSKKTNKLHACVMVSCNGTRIFRDIPNTLINEHVKMHQRHNQHRAMFVDGLCVHPGVLTKQECDQLAREFQNLKPAAQYQLLN